MAPIWAAVLLTTAETVCILVVSHGAKRNWAKREVEEEGQRLTCDIVSSCQLCVRTA
ncbi:hypothetical protein M430DRAFT_34386 [Amorphotheca resinae ATCC 22711]|uniref:Uncharacterized protein n=1 Tax=Amorphotheca resinae ATCC 22711 TaxID=857342 RepID=A0A2T3B749_AMORE|nr:hypothetical protein M430DRAFT_34386 [Amorphotheca resinae ATCC 22711]PSS22571.1 hypothetical protein M430DRAFT_34386 [Amorphotheca resinae ATCC 22711]